jgi:hypothetical protein
MRDHVRFRSTEFTPPTVEPGQINTERYGYSLATWVAARLRERGFEADAPVPEDWGWFLPIVLDGRAVRIGCGNVDGSVSEWLIFLDVARAGMFARLTGRTRESGPNAAYGIVAVIHSALQSSGHADEIEWFRVGARGEELDHSPTPI